MTFILISRSSSTQGQNSKELKASVRTAVTDTDQRLRKELKEKSKLLEEKLKLLRLKEAEFRRVSLSKDKAAKEVVFARNISSFSCCRIDVLSSHCDITLPPDTSQSVILSVDVSVSLLS